jgi:hypothetical protein
MFPVGMSVALIWSVTYATLAKTGLTLYDVPMEAGIQND